MNTQKLVATGVIVALILSVVGFFRGNNTIVNNPAPQYGSVTGPDNVNGYWNYAGFQEYFSRQTIRSATSTLCAIASPRATSTLVGFYSNITSAGGSTDSAGGTFYIATSTNPYATTTNLFAGTLVANATTTVSWLATTTDTTAQKWTVPPGTYIVFDVKGKLTYNYGGACYAEFRAFQ